MMNWLREQGMTHLPAISRVAGRMARVAPPRVLAHNWIFDRY
jgi:hypothetical protein